MNLLRLFHAEMIKTFLKKRTYLGFAVALVVIPIVIFALHSEGEQFLRRAMRNLSNDFLLLGNLFNGWLVSYQVMMAFWVHVPLLITFVAGDMLAGEATSGTYRLILIRSVSRTKLFAVKYLTTVCYVALFVGFLGGMSVGLALSLLGAGDLLVLRGGILVLPADDVAWRFVTAYLLAICPMLTVASIAFFLSSFVENAIGPIVGTMGFFIVLTILTYLPVEALDGVREYFFTYHMMVWQKVFDHPVPWSEVFRSLTNLAVHTLIAVGGAWVVFLRKDVLS